MSDATTLPSTSAVAAPRHSATLIVAATLAFVGAALTIGALFPDYWDAPPLALVDQTGQLAQTLVFAGALLVAGALLLGTRSAPVGATMLVVVVAVALQPRVVDAAELSGSDGLEAGTGFALASAGFVLALVSAVLAAIVTLRPRAWALRGGARPLAALAALAGFGAAVGFGMDPYELAGRRVSIGFGSPLEPLPRQLWAALLVVVVLTVVPPVAVTVGGRLGTGLALGLLFAIGGIAALRVGTVYGTVDGRDLGYAGAEGTWTFLAAGGAALIMTFAGLAAGAGRGTRRAPAPPPAAPVATAEEAPSSDELTQPMEVPSEAAVSEGAASEGAAFEGAAFEGVADEPEAPERVEPMRSATNSPPPGDGPPPE